MSAVPTTNVDKACDVSNQRVTNLCYRLHTPALFTYGSTYAWIEYKTNEDLTVAWRGS